MKVSPSLYLLVLLGSILLFTGCFKQTAIPVQLITDDIALLDIVDRYNAYTDSNRIVVTYIPPEELTASSIFEHVANSGITYDVIAGTYFPGVPLKNVDAAILPSYTINASPLFFSFFYDFMTKNLNMGVPYALDFPVFIAKGKKDELQTGGRISLAEFRELATAVNEKSEKRVEKVGFIPSLAGINELDFYFLFNSKLSKNDKQLSFISKSSTQAFDYFHLFNGPDFSEEELEAYLERFKKMDKKYYFKEDVVSFDITYFSGITEKTREQDTISLIKSLKYIGLNNKIISVSNKSAVKKPSIKFINFLLEEKQQHRLLTASYSSPSVYNKVHMPVRKYVLMKERDFIISPLVLEEYIDNLEYITFHDPLTQETFFNAYFYSQSMVQKELIDKKTFLTFFSDQLQK